MEDSGIGIAAAQKAVLNSASSDTSAISSSSSYECTLSQSTEDFTIVAPRAMITSVSKSQYCQVVFHGVSDVYPTDSDVKCRYTLTSDVNAQPGDKVALFRVGWLSVSEYITFERAPQPNEDGSNLYVTFTAGKLPKDTSSLYQLCYVTSGNVIAGASTPFTFHVPSESELVAVEDPTDPSMVVFKSRVSQLQCDLQTKTEEYQQLHLKQGLVEEKVHVLRMELDKVEAALKQSNDKVAELYTNKQSLEIDNKVLQERLTQFQQETHTVEALEEKLNQMKTEKNDCQEQLEELNKVQQKYEEIKKGFLSAKMENVELVARLSATYEALQEKTRCVESQLPTIHCLEQDCERSTRALKEQARLVESLSTQNEELSKKLRLLAVEHDKTKLENIVLSGRCMEAEKVAKNQTTSPRAATELEEEKEMLQVMLMTLEEHHSKCEEKITRLTSQLSEISFTPERQSDSASAIAGAVKQVATYFGIPPTPGGVRAHPTRPTSGDFDTNDEVAQLEKQLLEFKQDQATKKNRIEVLEIELRAAKDELLKLKKSPVGDSKPDCMLASNHLEVLSAGLPVINKFNEQVLVLSLLEEKITAERSENAELKNKIVDLLAKDSEMCGELRNLREKYDVAAKQLELLEATPEKETLDMLHQVLDHCVVERTEAKSELKAELEAKEKLEQQVVLLRAESVGKVSVDNSRKFHESIHVLESQVAEMEKFINYMKKFIHYTFDKRENKPIICPLCPTEFPHTAGKKFAAHFKQQHMK